MLVEQERGRGEVCCSRMGVERLPEGVTRDREVCDDELGLVVG